MKNNNEVDLVELDLHQTTPTEFIDVNGVPFAYRSMGNDRDVPLIFLQHFTGTLDDWDPIITNGFAKHFHVVLVNNQGIGSSGGKAPSTIESMAIDTVAFIKAMGFKKVNFLGFSMGGFIAQQVALDAPDLIGKIILVGTGPKGGEGIKDILIPLTESASMSVVDQKIYMFFGPTESSNSQGKKSQARIRRRLIDRDPDTKPTSVKSQLAAIMKWGGEHGHRSDKQIKQPVLIVNGSNDIVVPTINSFVMFNTFPNAKLTLYPDSGHGSLFQFPELFLSEAIPFLKTTNDW